MSFQSCVHGTSRRYERGSTEWPALETAFAIGELLELLPTRPAVLTAVWVNTARNVHTN